MGWTAGRGGAFPIGLVLTMSLAGCGITEPDPTLLLQGTVREELLVDRQVEAGSPVEGARVRVVFGSSGETQGTLAWTDTDASGRFSLEVGSPPGYSFPNCSVMAMEADADGYLTGYHLFFGHGSCRGESSITGIEILLRPDALSEENGS